MSNLHSPRSWRAGGTVLVAVVMLSATAPGSAQTPEAEDPSPSGTGFFALGFHRVDIAELNVRLEAEGYPAFGRSPFSIGGGGYTRRGGGWIVGGEGYALIAGDGAFDGRSVSLGGGYGLFNVGYAVPLLPALDVYPMAGFGGGGMSLAIGPRNTSDSFDGVLENPDRGARISRGGILLSLGGGIELRPAEGSRGVALGVRAGYLFEPSTSSWRLEGSPLSGAPGSSLAGPYLRVTVGGAG